MSNCCMVSLRIFVRDAVFYLSLWHTISSPRKTEAVDLATRGVHVSAKIVHLETSQT